MRSGWDGSRAGGGDQVRVTGVGWTERDGFGLRMGGRVSVLGVEVGIAARGESRITSGFAE